MVAEPYWINDRLAIVSRPRGGDWLDDEMAALREAGIDVVVSMLEEAEAAELGLDQERAAAARAGVDFVSYPIRDRGVPRDAHSFQSFLTDLGQQIEQGRRIGVHCRACIGRASVTTVSLLIHAGVPHDEAWRQVEAARGLDVPDTREQREWVDQNVRSSK